MARRASHARPGGRTDRNGWTVMRTTMTALVAAGALLLGACGGGDDDAKANDKKDDTPTSESKGDATNSDFCKKVVSLLTNTNTGPSGQALDAAKKLDPPAELSAEWKTWLDGISSMSSSGATFNPNDPAKAGEYKKIYAATQKVFTYIQDKCGLSDVVAPGTSTTTTGTG